MDTNKSKKIFSIGFGKCGTQTIHLFLRKNLNTSIHGGPNMKKWFTTGNISRIQNRARCYIYDSMTTPFNIGLIHKIYPDAFYILPTRSFVNWLISVVVHYNYKEITPQTIYDFLTIRNNYYQQLLSLNIKNIKIIDIEKQNICKTLVEFLPRDACKLTRKSLAVNKTPAHIITNKTALKEYILNVLQNMQISKEDAETPLIVYNINKDYQFNKPEFSETDKFIIEYTKEQKIKEQIEASTAGEIAEIKAEK